MRTRLFLVPALASLAGISTASAEVLGSETVVHDTTSWVEIDLNASTVLCSHADYSLPFLKVGLPELARITLLDHQNPGAGAPCVQAGECAPGNMPADLIDPTRPTELVSINVKAIRYDSVDTTEETCTTHLLERVNLTIRGKQFKHEAFADLGTRPYADCIATPAPSQGSAAPGPDDKADGPGAEPRGSSAGCSAGGGGAGAGALGLLAAVALRRRRR